MKPILFAVLAGLCWGVGEIFTKSALNSKEVGPLAAFLVRASGAAKDPALASGIWHFANSGPTTWFGLATEIRNEMIAAGVPVAATKLIPVTTAEFPRPARRPKNSVLSTKRLESEAGILPRSWREALHDYVALCARSAAGS